MWLEDCVYMSEDGSDIYLTLEGVGGPRSALEMHEIGVLTEDSEV